MYLKICLIKVMEILLKIIIKKVLMKDSWKKKIYCGIEIQLILIWEIKIIIRKK